MNIKVLELTDISGKFLISGTTPFFVNALRRTIIADVPKMAIEDVTFHMGSLHGEASKECESITPLFDEIIAHRLGLLPIPTDLKLYTFRDKCTCKGEGCPNCTIMYLINKKGPCTVFSGDLEPIGDPKLKIKDGTIPILKLNEGQAILAYPTAILGTGLQHAKWQTATAVGYKYYPVIKVDNRKCDDKGCCADKCPRNILKVKNKKLIIENVEECTMCGACEDACSSGAIKIDGDDTKFIFKFETDGSLTVKDVLEKALSILEEKFTEIEHIVEKLKEESDKK
ncbi:MAG: DNA-directed RNA polymerase subunit D [Thermoplasmata archaeon]